MDQAADTRTEPPDTAHHYKTLAVIVVAAPLDGDCEALENRLGLPVVAVRAAHDDLATSDWRFADSERDDIIEALARLQTFLALRPEGVQDEASLRTWAAEKLKEVRTLLDEADATLARGDHPFNAFEPLACASTEYRDAIWASDELVAMPTTEQEV